MVNTNRAGKISKPPKTATGVASNHFTTPERTSKHPCATQEIGGLENRPSVGEHRIGRYLSSISPLLSEYLPRGVTRKLFDDSIQARFAGLERFHAGAGLASAEEPMRVPIARESSGRP